LFVLFSDESPWMNLMNLASGNAALGSRSREARILRVVELPCNRRAV